VIEVQRTPWKLLVKKRQNYLEVYLYHRKSESNIWIFDVSVEFKLRNIREKNNKLREVKKTFDHTVTSWGGRLAKWEDLIKEEKAIL
ncbi:hypothetical protein PENTCL1PPCAC_23836, partial [Pristionchus entomophagus]